MAKKDKVRKKIADIFDLPPDIVLTSRESSWSGEFSYILRTTRALLSTTKTKFASASMAEV